MSSLFYAGFCKGLHPDEYSKLRLNREINAVNLSRFSGPHVRPSPKGGTTGAVVSYVRSEGIQAVVPG